MRALLFTIIGILVGISCNSVINLVTFQICQLMLFYPGAYETMEPKIKFLISFFDIWNVCLFLLPLICTLIIFRVYRRQLQAQDPELIYINQQLPVPNLVVINPNNFVAG